MGHSGYYCSYLHISNSAHVNIFKRHHKKFMTRTMRMNANNHAKV